MSEKTMRSLLVKVMNPELHAGAVESGHTWQGIPDISYAHGFVECKDLPKPNSRSGLIKVGHPLTILQHRWLVKRSNAGGTALVCVRVACKEWWFIHPNDAEFLVETSSIHFSELAKHSTDCILTGGKFGSLQANKTILLDVLSKFG